MKLTTIPAGILGKSTDQHMQARTRIQAANTDKTIKVFSATSSISQTAVTPYGITYVFYAVDQLLDTGGIVLDTNELKRTVLPMSSPQYDHDSALHRSGNESPRSVHGQVQVWKSF